MARDDLVAVFAVDPGTTTGIDYGIWRLNSRPDKARIEDKGFAYELTDPLLRQAQIVAELWERNSELNYGIPAYMVIEKYVQRPTPHMVEDSALNPVKLGYMIVGYLAGLYETVPQIVWQMPSAAMTYATDARLRDWGHWLVGNPHARDARRHSLAFVASLGNGRRTVS